MLTDTGPLVALLDRDDAYHSACLTTLGKLPRSPLVTTWACLTEAMYLLGHVGGNLYQSSLWQWWRDGRLDLLDITKEEANRMAFLMAQYDNVPMDFADASLVAVAESRGYKRIFSIDSDFYIYRLADGSVLEVVR